MQRCIVASHHTSSHHTLLLFRSCRFLSAHSLDQGSGADEGPEGGGAVAGDGVNQGGGSKGDDNVSTASTISTNRDDQSGTDDGEDDDDVNTASTNKHDPRHAEPFLGVVDELLQSPTVKSVVKGKGKGKRKFEDLSAGANNGGSSSVMY